VPLIALGVALLVNVATAAQEIAANIAGRVVTTAVALPSHRDHARVQRCRFRRSRR
jgi:hypothetical protein